MRAKYAGHIDSTTTYPYVNFTNETVGDAGA